ncbi:hypothetical protein PY254_10465 [Rhodanobacter sp. AS-Z3]|uniref:hypothetical protein n=1 Tax=Rhodanobacter sp. AS-Z3 TaxID=3031330 RepID=UPI002478C57B|nr:hypothetical protein [Rhodanobacter sp. AS-Z3]WEN13669.1 hypothetical protein PY254_10465 [Rhodanobacter sp. AS-Z3]
MNTQPAANDPTMDLQQAADFLHLGLKSMKELVDSGAVPALSLNQKHTILLRDDLIAYVREQGRAQAARRRSRKPIDAPPTRAKRSTSKPNLDAYERTGGDR